jgi:hypothetical protein
VVTSSDGSATTLPVTLTLNNPNAPSDTPAMPPWALLTLGLLLVCAAARSLPLNQHRAYHR